MDHTAFKIVRGYQDSRNDIQAKIIVTIPEGCTEDEVARFLVEMSADLVTQFNKAESST